MKKFMMLASAVMVLGSSVALAKVIGRVNGYPITERSANAFLKVVTKGKLKYGQLRPKDKKDVIKRIAPDALLIGMARHHLTELERNQILVNYWLAQKTRNIKISRAEVKKAYKDNRKFFKDPKGKILPFEKVKAMIEVSLKQKKYVAQLMDRAKVTMGKTVIKAPKKTPKRQNKPKKQSATASTGAAHIYVVQSGNTLSGIAHKYHTTIKQLRLLNGMSESDTLKIGQKLKVPVQ